MFFQNVTHSPLTSFMIFIQHLYSSLPLMLRAISEWACEGSWCGPGLGVSPTQLNINTVNRCKCDKIGLSQLQQQHQQHHKLPPSPPPFCLATATNYRFVLNWRLVADDWRPFLAILAAAVLPANFAKNQRVLAPFFPQIEIWVSDGLGKYANFAIGIAI